MVNVQTLLQILFANGHEDIVARAVQLDAGIKQTTPETIVLRVYKDKLPKGKIFDKKEGWGYVRCKVMLHNEYKMKSDYLVELPNGTTEWASDEGKNTESVIIDEEPTAPLAALSNDEDD